MQKFGKFCLVNAIHGTIDVEISLAKGIVFTKIGLANGAILKLWAAHPYPKFSQEPPLWFEKHKKLPDLDKFKPMRAKISRFILKKIHYSCMF